MNQVTDSSHQNSEKQIGSNENVVKVEQKKKTRRHRGRKKHRRNPEKNGTTDISIVTNANKNTNINSNSNTNENGKNSTLNKKTNNRKICLNVTQSNNVSEKNIKLKEKGKRNSKGQCRVWKDTQVVSNNSSKNNLDTIMQIEKKKVKNSIMNIINENNNIDNVLTEDELLQTAIMASMTENNIKNDECKINEINEINEKNIKNINNINNINDDIVDNDYLIAMSLQENEESKYYLQKQELERMSGNMGNNNNNAKVKLIDRMSENSLKFYYKNDDINDKGNNKLNKDDKDDKDDKDNKNGSINKIDLSLFEWTGGHVESSGTQLRHDKKTWSKKHVQRMNDYDGIGSSINEKISIGNQAYNSFCRAVERKGFKKEYL